MRPHFIFPIALAVFAFLIVATPRAQALFGHVKAEQVRRQETQQQLVQEQQRTLEQQRLTTHQQQLTHRWQTIASLCGAGSVVTLVIGCAIGSKTGRDHAR